MLEKCGSIVSKLVDLMVEEYKKRPGNAYMFLSFRTAGIFGPDFFLHTHEKIFVAIGAEHIQFHNLWHTFVTTALEYGMDVKALSAVAGHRSSSTTLNVYTHVTKAMERQAAAKIDQGDRKAGDPTRGDPGDEAPNHDHLPGRPWEAAQARHRLRPSNRGTRAVFPQRAGRQAAIPKRLRLHPERMRGKAESPDCRHESGDPGGAEAAPGSREPAMKAKKETPADAGVFLSVVFLWSNKNGKKSGR